MGLACLYKSDGLKDLIHGAKTARHHDVSRAIHKERRYARDEELKINAVRMIRIVKMLNG